MTKGYSYAAWICAHVSYDCHWQKKRDVVATAKLHRENLRVDGWGYKVWDLDMGHCCLHCVSYALSLTLTK